MNNNEVKLDVSTPVIFSLKEIESKKKNEPKNEPNVIKIDRGTQTEIERPKITIQEVIPQRTEYQITSAPKDATTVKSPIKIIEDSSNELIDSQSYASEKTEVYDHPPPVLRIGDQLLFFKQGQLVPEKDASTPSPVITLIGAEGLQIGVGSEEIIEHELLPTNTDEPIKKVDDGLQDISLNTSEEKENTEAFESVTGASISDEKVSSEEYISVKDISEVPEETKIVEISSTEIPKEKLTTINTLEAVEVPNVKTAVKKNFKPIKRDQESTVSVLETSTNKIEVTSAQSEELTTSETKISTSTEFIPEENPYYPPLPEDIITPEEETDHEEHKHATTGSSIEISTKSTTIEIVTTELRANDTKKLQEKTLKELKSEGKLDELMTNDQPISESSESESKEDVLDAKKHVDVTSGSTEESASTEDVTKEDKKEVQLADPELSSSEEASEELQKDQPLNDEEVSKILPNVIPLLNITLPSTTEKSIDWLKNENEEKDPEEKDKEHVEEKEDMEQKDVAPLMNERAALPREILEMPAETDAIAEADKKEIVVEKKSGKERPVENIPEAITTESGAESKETTEISDEDGSTESSLRVLGLGEESTTKESDETKESKETSEEIDGGTTETPALKDAELLQREKKNDDKELMTEETNEPPQSKSDIVAPETSITKLTTELEKSKETLEVSDESSRETTTNRGEHSDIMAGDDASIEVTKDSSQMDTSELVETVPGFENITDKNEKMSSEESSEESNANTHPKSEVEVIATTELSSENQKIDEKHKRDVVKKVLKDTFENPKENIQTELKEDAPTKVLEEIEREHELIEKLALEEDHAGLSHEIITESFDSEVKIEDDFGDNPTKTQTHHKTHDETPPNLEEKKGTEVIQKVGSVKKFRESTENLDTSLIGIFRNFFSKSQMRYAGSADEKV